MTEPVCIWIYCTNTVQLYSREYVVRVCSQHCLTRYLEYKKASPEKSDRFKELWFIHISLLYQIFYEVLNYGKESDTTEKLSKELQFNNEKISEMAIGSEENLMHALTQYTKDTLSLFSFLSSQEQQEEQEEREEKWREKVLQLLEVLQLSQESVLVDAMNKYANNLLSLMKAMLRKDSRHYCLFKLLVISVTHLSHLIQSHIAKLSPQLETPTMMLRPENGRIQKK